MLLTFFAAKGTLLAHVYCLPISPELLCSLAGPSHDWCKGLIRPNVGLWHLSLLNFIIFTLAHSSSQSRSLWMAVLPSSMSAAPPNLVSSANLMSKQHSVTFSRSLVMMLKSSPSTDGCSTPLVTNSLTTALGAQLSNQFFTHLVFTHLY